MRTPGQRTALLIIGMQIDMCEHGAIGLEGGREIAERISGYVTANGHKYDLIVGVRDVHSPDHPTGFHHEPDGANLFSVPHCVEGTHGADYNYNILNIEHDMDAQAVEGLDDPGDSAFDAKLVSTGEPLIRALTNHGITTVDIVGMPLERQVKATAVDAVANEFACVVLIDMCASRSVPESAAAVEEMEGRGVQVRRSSVWAV